MDGNDEGRVRPMDPFSLLAGAAVALIGVAVGRILPNRRKPTPPVQRVETGNRPAKPMCGCGHHLVFHDNDKRTCHAQVAIPGRWTGEHGNHYRNCMCQGYRGPTPIDEYYAPELLTEHDPSSPPP